MDTIVMKFGGSSVADNDKLKIVAQKIIDMYNKENNIVVILSAQGKTTDKLINEASQIIEENTKYDKNTKNSDIEKCSSNSKKNTSTNLEYFREMDMLLSSGEQISISKLSILLNKMGYKSISLTGWQAGILTDNTNQNAIIKNIDTTRILQELEKRKIVIIAGFQGYNENLDITTLGRGGSDTSAIAIAAALKAKECYIFSDVDGVYTADPNKIPEAKKIPALSYNEMMEISSEGAKVLHNRCAEIGDKFKIPIITKSTFNNKAGTIITDIIEENTIKSIVKKDISRISIVGNGVIRNYDFIKKYYPAIDNYQLIQPNHKIKEKILLDIFKIIAAYDHSNQFQRIEIESYILHLLYTLLSNTLDKKTNLNLQTLHDKRIIRMTQYID